MRRVIFVVMVLVSLSLAGPALALPGLTPTDPPSWWDNADKQRSDTVTIENTAGTGQSEGTYTVFLENLNDPDRVKEVYLVLEWYTIDDVNGSINVDKDVTISWPGGPQAPGVSMGLNVDDQVVDPNTGVLIYHLEYEHGIRPQPEPETVFFKYSGIDVDEQLVLEYDLRTKCFEGNGIPEPSGLALLAFGAVGLARRKRS